MRRPIYRLHNELRGSSLYAVVDLPQLSADPVSLSLAGLRPESKATLRSLLRGDEIPSRIIDEMLALAPRFVSEQLATGGRGPSNGTDGAD